MFEQLLLFFLHGELCSISKRISLCHGKRNIEWIIFENFQLYQKKKLKTSKFYMNAKIQDNENDEYITNRFYLEQVENKIHEEIDKITIQCKIKQQEQKFEQLEMEYLLCDTNSKEYIIELTRKIESMENI